MRDFKKYFFESLLQLTILASVFRQNSRFTFITNNNNNNLNDSLIRSYTRTFEPYSTIGQLDFLFYRENLNQTNNLINETSGSYRSKEIISNLKDLQAINIFNRFNLHPLNNQIPNIPSQNLLLLPASFLNNTTSNQKGLVDLTETRLLLNSIELNLNNPILKKEFEMDIELQTLIEQDIDFGIQKEHFYYTQTQSKNEKDLIKAKNSFDQYELEFKNEDILSTTQYIEHEKVPDDCRLFVEEDTGELFFASLDAAQKINASLHVQSLNSSTNQNVENLKLNLKIGLENQSLFDSLPKKTNGTLLLPPYPPFLSQLSVCKTLNNLNNENESSHSCDGTIASNQPSTEVATQSSSNADISSLTFNETIFNDFFHTSILTETDLSQNYELFGVQSEMFNQPQEQQVSLADQNSSLKIEQNKSAEIFQTNTSRINLLGDQFLFEDQFLKEFEANLDKFDTNDFNKNQQESTIRNDQTIGAYTSIKKLSPVYLSEQTIGQESDVQNEIEPFNDQLNINELFKLFDDNNNNNNNYTATTTPITKSYIIDANKTTNDDEAKILKNFKQESFDVEHDLSISNSQSSRLISIAANLNNSEELSATIRGLQHNHTYLDGRSNSDESETFHPYSYKNKLKKMLKNMDNEEANNIKQQESRDQLLLQENQINASLTQVVDSNADEFNEIVKELHLNHEQITIIKDIRRRGKNKVAAQICRKRKIDSIESLKEDVDQLNEMKSALENEHDLINDEIRQLTKQFDDLYKHLMGENRDLNDPMFIYMNNLKVQINNKNRNNNNKENSLVRSLNSDQSDSNSDEYDESSNQSLTDITDINTVFDDQIGSNSKANFNNKIKKFRKY